jgi:hypothetical protein
MQTCFRLFVKICVEQQISRADHARIQVQDSGSLIPPHIHIPALWKSFGLRLLAQNGQDAGIMANSWSHIHVSPHRIFLFQLGVNGYSFSVNNNGYILYHPDLRPMVSPVGPTVLLVWQVPVSPRVLIGPVGY